MGTHGDGEDGELGGGEVKHRCRLFGWGLPSIAAVHLTLCPFLRGLATADRTCGPAGTCPN